MKIEDAIKFMLDGRGLLFTGAGFFYGAKNLLDNTIPAGSTLAKELIAAIGIEGQADLDRASAAYLRKRSPDELVKLLKDNYTVTTITDSHKIIANLDWLRVYTTNYDSVYEKARREICKSTRTVTSRERPNGLVSYRDLVVHVNGSIDTLSKDELFNSFKLTSASYAAESFDESGWAFHFRNDVRSSAVIVFVGYSLYDLDIARVLFAEDVTSKAIFIVAHPSAENELELFELQEYGEVFRIGVDAFAQQIHEISKTYKPIEAPLLLNLWEKVEPARTTKLPSDKDVIEFFTEGIIKDSIRAQINGPSSFEYVIPRSLIAQVKESILDNRKHVILHGSLGCGKTFIADSFGLIAYGAGWNVFTLRSEAQEEIGELQEIIKAGSGNIILVIESYHRHMRLIRWIVEARLDNVILLLTDRTDVHELFVAEISERFQKSYVELDCTKLENEEVEYVSTLLDKYGLWGQQLSWAPVKKARYIKEKCASELPSLLVDVLKSTHITQKYHDIVSAASDPRAIQKILICLFTLEVMNYDPATPLIQELLGGKNIRWSYIKSCNSLKSIVDFGANYVRARSAVLGLHLLHSLFTPKDLVETLIQMSKEADERSHTREYREIVKDLMRFKYVALILPEKQRLQSTVTFYEGIKNLNLTKKDPQFWLQYGIASLTLEQMDRAERYFKDAYSLASAMHGYDCFQIDNHYARFLLTKAMLEVSKESAISLAEKAKTILIPQMRKEDRHYPFRAALGIFDVHSKWKNDLTQNQIQMFNGVFAEIHKRCLAAGATIRNNRHVIECAEKAKEKLSSMGIFEIGA